MRRGRAVAWTRRMVAALAAILFALLGLPHALAHRGQAPPDLAAYALPDGTEPTLCADTAGGSAPRDDRGPLPCLIVCLQALGAPVLLAAAGPVVLLASGRRLALVLERATDKPRATWRGARARAPPILLASA